MRGAVIVRVAAEHDLSRRPGALAACRGVGEEAADLGAQLVSAGECLEIVAGVEPAFEIRLGGW